MSNLNFVQLSSADEKSRRRASHKSSIPIAAFSALWAFADGFAVCALNAFCSAIYDAFVLRGTIQLAQSINEGLMLATIFVGISFVYGDYKFERIVDGRKSAVRSFQAWLFSFLALAWIAFLTKTSADISRGSIMILFVFGWLIIFWLRKLGANLLTVAIAKNYVSLQRAYLVAAGSLDVIEQLSTKLAKEGAAIVGTNRLTALTKGEYRQKELLCKSMVHDVRSALQKTKIDAVYLFLPWEDWNFVTQMTRAFQDLPLPVYLFAEPKYNSVLASASSKIGGELAFIVERGPLTMWEIYAKRFADIIISVLGIILLSPILLSATIAILVTSGRPIIFYQSRRGFGGKPFNIYKFRTMNVTENGSKIVQAKRDDQRVTPVGRVLRRTSIDELPQLFNVLFGHMSIVGPRPHAVAHDNHYDSKIATYAFRQHVKPGITGWAQVNGQRGETTEVRQMETRVELDLWYINNWSFKLDIRIILKTAATVLFDRSVY